MPEPSARARRPTQSDVAALAGVSRTIVSAVINGPEAQAALRVSSAARDRVLAAIEQVGYIPNVAARSLASGRNDIIGVFTYEPVFPMDNGSYYHDILLGIEDEADRTGHSLLLSNARKDRGERAIYHAQANTLRVADGVIVIGGRIARDELTRLHAERFPCVIVGRRELPGVEPSWVAPDYVAGTRRAVEALLALGHTRLGFVTPAASTEPSRDRLQGFIEATDIAGLSDHVVHLPLGSGDQLLRQVVNHQLTAVLSAAHADAEELVLAARAAGIAVPTELSVLSLGGTSDAAGSVRVAELKIPHRDLGREAVRTLLALLGGTAAAPVRLQLDCTLDLEPTVGPAPSRR